MPGLPTRARPPHSPFPPFPPPLPLGRPPPLLSRTAERRNDAAGCRGLPERLSGRVPLDLLSAPRRQPPVGAHASNA